MQSIAVSHSEFSFLLPFLTVYCKVLFQLSADLLYLSSASCFVLLLFRLLLSSYFSSATVQHIPYHFFPLHPKITALYLFTIPVLPSCEQQKLLAAVSHLVMKHPKFSLPYGGTIIPSIPSIMFLAPSFMPPFDHHLLLDTCTIHSSRRLNFVRKAMQKYLTKI